MSAETTDGRDTPVPPSGSTETEAARRERFMQRARERMKGGERSRIHTLYDLAKEETDRRTEQETAKPIPGLMYGGKLTPLDREESEQASLPAQLDSLVSMAQSLDLRLTDVEKTLAVRTWTLLAAVFILAALAAYQWNQIQALTGH